MTLRSLTTIFLLAFVSCKDNAPEPPAPPATPFNVVSATVDGQADAGLNFRSVSVNPTIKVTFSTPINPAGLNNSILFNQASGVAVPFNASVENGNILIITPSAAVSSYTAYKIVISNLLSTDGTRQKTSVTLNLQTGLDPADKFQRISDDELLTLVQKQTFRYFWDFGHPVSGLSRERNTSGDLVTSGGSGFGIMSLVTGIHRQFITRAEGLGRMQKIVNFLKNNTETFHGAFPHWLNGATGAAIPFSQKDDGADLVETSYLMQGLLTARQYFNGADASETELRENINALWNAVEWSWFRRDNQDVLYWHWSQRYNWDMNFKVEGWNEALITYVLASSSANYSVPKSVYDNGWARSGAFRNGNSYFGVQLPLGPDKGGPLFFAHYSFLGINPNGLTDAYANYGVQNTAHTLINYNYCVGNPKGFAGYGPASWGLTASDDKTGYLAHEPNNDNGTISPTAALSSFPYTPKESTEALHFFYYKLGDKLWGQYGFYDAYNLNENWFASSTLAIDQGPIIVMIENYRSGLLWNLFMSCPEVKTGMKKLGFQSPQL